MADKDEVDPTQQSGDSAGTGPQASGPSADAATPRSRRSGSHPLGRSADGRVAAGRGAGPDDEPGSDADRTDSDRTDSDRTDSDRTDSEGDADLELVPVGAPAREQRAGSTGDVVAGGRQKKVRATPRQKQVAEKQRRTGPATFVRESVSELQKVVYPTGQQLANYFVVVLIFVLFIIAIVSVLDLAFGKAIIAIFS